MSKIHELTGKENHFISLAEFNDFTENYRRYFGEDAIPGGFITRSVAQELIAPSEAKGLRYYYAQNPQGEMMLVFLGTGAFGSDLTNAESAKVSAFMPVSGQLFSPAPEIHNITEENAGLFTANYRRQSDAEQPMGGCFAKEAVESLLNQEGCQALGFLFGAKTDGTRVLCLTGLDKNGEKMLHGKLLELSVPCPPFCPMPNIFNNDSVFSERLTKSLLQTS